jgi:hypothetical protein
LRSNSLGWRKSPYLSLYSQGTSLELTPVIGYFFLFFIFELQIPSLAQIFIYVNSGKKIYSAGFSPIVK